MIKFPLFNRMYNPGPVARVAFSGNGVLPDLFSEHAPSVLNVASKVYPVEEGILGRDSMLPPSGTNRPVNPAYKGVDGQTGGAGSMATATAWGAKG